MLSSRIAFSNLLFIALVLFSGIFAAEERDYELAIETYRRGDYVLSSMYFENILEDQGLRQHFPDAVFHLTKIHDARGDFVHFVSWATRFMSDYPYDTRAKDILALFLKRLTEKKSYLIAANYVEEFDYLVIDYSIVEPIGHGLMAQGEMAKADYVFSLGHQTDTIKILRAMMKSDYRERQKIFETLEGASRNLYVVENDLLLGDTVSAFVNFQNLSERDLDAGGLYRYAKLALLFRPDDVSRYTEDLRAKRGYATKAKIIDAIARRRPEVQLIPEDAEEIRLYQQLCGLDTVSKEPPEDIALDSLLAEAEDTLALMAGLRQRYKNNYLLDSVYCQQLVNLGSYNKASESISSYLKYANTQGYVRKILGFERYVDRAYHDVAKHMILSNQRSPSILYLLAECFRQLGYNSGDLYTKVMDLTADSLLYMKALNGYVLDRYEAAAFDEICSVDVSDLQGDTSTIRMYIHSLARCGQRERADSLFHHYFDEPDYMLLNLHGEHLINEKEYDRAKVYYDSMVQEMADIFDDQIYYNWALISFLNGKMDEAHERFRFYIANFQRSLHYHDALFKIATLSYLAENYDSAAHYYGLASEKETLTSDALDNQLISYKKAGNWPMVIETGRKLLGIIDKEGEARVRFDIGYAFLRVGKTKEAVENLLVASRMKPDPGYYYWLGEAYLGRGDFTRALYSYQKIIDLYARDDMWMPTAQYKTGIVLELLDETGAARDVYRQLIKQRGINDPIAIEANIRLQRIEE